MRTPINRRTFLQGAGVCIGLPFLEAMMPLKAHAQSSAPLRAVMMMFPNGVYQNTWAPVGSGTSYSFSSNLAALSPYRNRIIMPQGLKQYWGGVDGAGDHARASGAFLTCVRVVKSTQNAQVGISADQKMANLVAAKNPGIERLLYLGDSVDTYADTGNGYAQSYGNHISWRQPTVPETKLTNPQTVFNKLFGSQTMPPPTQDALADYRRLTRRSILDSVLGQVSSLKVQLGSSDREKMDQYLTALREVERKISSAPVEPEQPTNQCPQVQNPGSNLSFDKRMRAMMDLVVLAMACDKARVITYLLAGEGSGQNYGFIGVNGGHHDISHYPDNPNYPAQYQKITEWYAQQLAYLLKRMTEFKEGDGDLLSNSMVVYGSGFRDGNQHDDNNLPIVVAGEAGGRWKTGRAINTNGAPIANLWLTMMKAFGSTDNSHGDSTGTLNFS